MTEQTPEIVEPKSLPEALRGDGPASPEGRGVAMVAWGLVGLMLAGGLVTMALTWRGASLPSLPDGPAISFDLPELSLPERRPSPDRAPPVRTEPAPEAMARGAGPDARPVGQIEKPGGDLGPEPGAAAGELSGGTGKPL